MNACCSGVTALRLCRGLDVTVGELLDDLPLPMEPCSTMNERKSR